MTDATRLVDASGHVVEEAVPTGPVVPVVPEGVTSSQTVTVSSGPTSAGWVSTNLRNFVVIVLTSTLIYLAVWVRNESAIVALITAWTWSAGGMFQERAALKTPGKDM